MSVRKWTACKDSDMSAVDIDGPHVDVSLLPPVAGAPCRGCKQPHRVTCRHMRIAPVFVHLWMHRAYGRYRFIAAQHKIKVRRWPAWTGRCQAAGAQLALILARNSAMNHLSTRHLLWLRIADQLSCQGRVESTALAAVFAFHGGNPASLPASSSPEMLSILKLDHRMCDQLLHAAAHKPAGLESDCAKQSIRSACFASRAHASRYSQTV